MFIFFNGIDLIISNTGYIKQYLKIMWKLISTKDFMSSELPMMYEAEMKTLSTCKEQNIDLPVHSLSVHKWRIEIRKNKSRRRAWTQELQCPPG